MDTKNYLKNLKKVLQQNNLETMLKKYKEIKKNRGFVNSTNIEELITIVNPDANVLASHLSSLCTEQYKEKWELHRNISFVELANMIKDLNSRLLAADVKKNDSFRVRNSAVIDQARKKSEFVSDNKKTSSPDSFINIELMSSIEKPDSFNRKLENFEKIDTENEIIEPNTLNSNDPNSSFRLDSVTFTKKNSLQSISLMNKNLLKSKSLENEIINSSFPVNKADLLEKQISDNQTVNNIKYSGFKETIQKYKEFIEFRLKSEDSYVSLLKSILDKAFIQLEEGLLESFCDEVFVVTYSARINMDQSSLSFKMFAKACKNWFKNVLYPNKLRTKLINNVKDYFEIKPEIQNDNDLLFLESLMSALIQKIKILSQNPKKNTKNYELTEKTKAGIHEIFLFYSKQQFLLGKAPTFDSINRNSEVLTISKFLLFCKDFGLIKNSKNPRKIKSRSKIFSEIFRKNSNFGREMHEYQFVSALKSIAEVYFNEEYDTIHQTRYFNYSLQEKTKKLYEILNFDNEKIYKTYLKGNISHFGCYPSRIPDNDLSKHYKLSPKKHKKMKTAIKEWKEKKIENQKMLSFEKSRKNISFLSEKSVSLKSLINSTQNDFELENFIDQRSSDEDLYESLNPRKLSHISKSISNKTLKRANELKKSTKKQEKQSFNNLIKVCNNFYERSMKYAEKYKK